MVGIGNNITATVETIDCCAANLIDTSVLEVHIQGIAFSNMATLWLFTKNAAIYGAIVGNGYKRAIFNRATGFIGYGMEKFSTSDRTMIYEGRGRRKKITALIFPLFITALSKFPLTMVAFPPIVSLHLVTFP